jgi:dethiobiotin synthetase
VLTPLSDVATNLDLARALQPATMVLVAPDALGVLHDLRACELAMRTLFRRPDLLVLSRSRPVDASTGTNAAELSRFGLAPCAVIGQTPDFELAPLLDALALAQGSGATQGR